MCVTLHLDHHTADALLTARGWEIVRGEDPHTHRPWRYFLRPGGKRRGEGGTITTDYVWHAHQALTDAFEAEIAPVAYTVHHLNGDPTDNHVENLVLRSSTDGHQIIAD